MGSKEKIQPPNKRTWSSKRRALSKSKSIGFCHNFKHYKQSFSNSSMKCNSTKMSWDNSKGNSSRKKASFTAKSKILSKYMLKRFKTSWHLSKTKRKQWTVNCYKRRRDNFKEKSNSFLKLLSHQKIRWVHFLLKSILSKTSWKTIRITL